MKECAENMCSLLAAIHLELQKHAQQQQRTTTSHVHRCSFGGVESEEEAMQHLSGLNDLQLVELRNLKVVLYVHTKACSCWFPSHILGYTQAN